MIYKVTITGTESTGKSTLAEELALHYKTCSVPDYSRYYIDQLNRKYSYADVEEIARGIIEQENEYQKNARSILFSDNDLLNIKIWMEFNKWHIPDWLKEEITKRKSDLYILCDIDLDWVEDSQRKNPMDRVELFYRFLNELNGIDAEYKIVSGKNEERLQMAIRHVNSVIPNNDSKH